MGRISRPERLGRAETSQPGAARQPSVSLSVVRTLDLRRASAFTLGDNLLKSSQLKR